MNEQESRRKFLKTAGILSVLTFSGTGIISACGKKDEGQKVSPPEDLMQEHGLLNRVLLIYDYCKTQLQNRQPLQLELLNNAAGIIKTFVEDYHEKQEENYLFSRFEKANQLIELVAVLKIQHDKGRLITAQIQQISSLKSPLDGDRQTLITLLSNFNSMYRPHEAREDTVLFPAFRKIVSRHEYDSLGEEFEDNEHKLFGEDGFETMVDKVASIEKQLGIFDLNQFTP